MCIYTYIVSTHTKILNNISLPKKIDMLNVEGFLPLQRFVLFLVSAIGRLWLYRVWKPKKLEDADGSSIRWFSGLYFEMICNQHFEEHMDVSKNRGIPKWMVYNGKPY